MNLQDLKMLASGSVWLTKLPFNMMSRSSIDFPIYYAPAWEEEKTEILERTNWLCDNVIISPKQLLNKMPALLGPNYGGQWAIYSCCMLAFALRNISALYEETKEENLKRMEKLIPVIMTPELRNYDTMYFKDDALATLEGNKSHMTYLSLLAWAITNYKLAGGTSNEFDETLHGCCEALHRRMNKRKDLCLPSFPNGIVFFPDFLVTIVALKNYALLYNGTYSDDVANWLERAKDGRWLHKKTGLLYSEMYTRWGNKAPRGSYAGLCCSYLSLVDEDFAKDQYDKMKKYLVKRDPVIGIREYLNKSPKFAFDPNAGPISFGMSPSGTAFAIGAATYLGDWEFRSQLLRTAEIAGDTVKGKNTQHYRLGELAMVGEAVTLAMRTNKKN